MRSILMIAGLPLLAACDPAPSQPEVERPAHPAFETRIQAVDKARAVEDTAREAAEARRLRLDAATPP